MVSILVLVDGALESVAKEGITPYCIIF